MASAAEQLASNFNFGAFNKATELKKRIWFTLGALVIYRLGTYIPLPGIDPQVIRDIFDQGAGGITDMMDLFTGGALGRMSIFALNIMPYISAAIIMQLLQSTVPKFEAMKKEGEPGRKKLNQYTRYGTVFLATFQAYGLSVGVEGIASASGAAVLTPGFFFRATTVISLVGGTIFLMWLGEQVTQRGVGNGISLIIFAGIVAELPSALVATMDLGRRGVLSAPIIIGILVLAVVVITVIVFIERAQRRIVVQYPKRQVGQKMFGGESSHIPLKVNTPGVIPPIFASSILLLPLSIFQFAGNAGPDWLNTMIAWLGRGQPGFIGLYILFIVFFTFFYTAIVFNPQETADNLRQHGGFVPGIRPGKNTAEYLDHVLTRLTVLGAIYLVIVCIIPEWLISQFNVPFYFGGTSLLIVVSVTMDTVGQVHSHMLAHQYEGLIKKSRLRGRRG